MNKYEMNFAGWRALAKFSGLLFCADRWH